MFKTNKECVESMLENNKKLKRYAERFKLFEFFEMEPEPKHEPYFDKYGNEKTDSYRFGPENFVSIEEKLDMFSFENNDYDCDDDEYEYYEMYLDIISSMGIKKEYLKYIKENLKNIASNFVDAEDNYEEFISNLFWENERVKKYLKENLDIYTLSNEELETILEEEAEEVEKEKFSLYEKIITDILEERKE